MKVLCCLRDKVANKYFAPSCFENEDCAVRDAFSLFQESFGKRSKDYEIVHVGFFDDDQGVIQASSKTILLDGASLVFKDSNESEDFNV